MESRVKKYADLHQQIASDTESTVENSDLSHFANRLSEIDDQFERVSTSRQDVLSPSRARKPELSGKVDQSPVIETFETDYLKDFLKEVKEYNVQKGYRDISDTQANILEDLRKDFSNDARKPLSENNQEELEATQAIYSEKKLAKIAEELIAEEHRMDQGKHSKLEETQIFEPVFVEPAQEEETVLGEHLELDENETKTQEDDHLNQANDEQTISMAIHDMSFSDDDYEDEADIDNFQLHEDESIAHKNKIKDELFEQTQSLSRKVLDLEHNLDEMTSSSTKTNRLLHVVLSLLLFSIIVVALMIVAQVLAR